MTTLQRWNESDAHAPLTQFGVFFRLSEARALIERGMAKLARPLPAPRCDRPGASGGRLARSARFMVDHIRRGGRLS